MKNSINREKSFLTFLKGTDFVTLLSALIASAYGLSLVYSATHSSLKVQNHIIGCKVNDCVCFAWCNYCDYCVKH